VAAVGRRRIAKAIKARRMSAPKTEFTRRDGTEVSVNKVVYNDVPRLLFLLVPQAQMKLIATPRWQQAMDEAAATLPDRLAKELTARLEHRARKGRRGPDPGPSDGSYR
jgi:hypothetical protein